MSIRMKLKLPKAKQVKKAFLIATYSLVVIVMIAGSFAPALMY